MLHEPFTMFRRFWVVRASSGLIRGQNPTLLNLTLRVQVPNYLSYTLQNSHLHNYYPKAQYLIEGSFGPFGLRGTGNLETGNSWLSGPGGLPI